MEICGHVVTRRGSYFEYVKGPLECFKCKKNVKEIVAIRETKNTYCYPCFLNNVKEIYKDKPYLELAVLRNHDRDPNQQQK